MVRCVLTNTKKDIGSKLGGCLFTQSHVDHVIDLQDWSEWMSEWGLVMIVLDTVLDGQILQSVTQISTLLVGCESCTEKVTWLIRVVLHGIGWNNSLPFKTCISADPTNSEISFRPCFSSTVVESSVQSPTPAEPPGTPTVSPGTPAASPGENVISFLYALLWGPCVHPIGPLWCFCHLPPLCYTC